MPLLNGLPQLARLKRLGEEDDQQTTIPALDPAEEPGLLRQLSHKALSGLGYVGGVLDKTFGGRAIRGALGGKARELASIIPGSDMLGITDENDRVSGTDLLQKAGVFDQKAPEDQGWGETIAGMATEMALDPGTFLTLGAKALTPAGLAAKKAGTLSKTVSQRIGNGQGGLFALGLPFAEKYVPSIATTPTAKKIADFGGKVLDKAVYSKPGAYASSLFDKRVQGATEPGLQRILRASDDARKASEIAGRKSVFDSARPLIESGDADKYGELRQLSEGVASNATSPQLAAASQTIRQTEDALANRLEGAGANFGGLDDPFAEYVTRELTLPDRSSKGFGGSRGRDLPTVSGSQMGRNKALKGIPGGTETLNAIGKDPEISGILSSQGLPRDASGVMNPNPLAKAMGKYKTQYLGLDAAKEAQLLQLTKNEKSLNATEQALIRQFRKGKLTDPAQIQTAQNLITQGMARDPQQFALYMAGKNALDATRFWAGIDPKYASEGLSFFGNNPLADVLTGLERGTKTEYNNKAIVDYFVKGAKHYSTASPDSVRIDKALRAAGLQTRDRPQFMADLKAKLGINPGMKPKDQKRALQSMFVPKESLRQATKVTSAGEVAPGLKPIVEGVDWFTNLFKNFTTPLWPSSQVRNFTSNTANLLQMGAKPFQGGKSLIEGKTIEGLAAKIPQFAGMTDEQATKALADLSAVHKIYSPIGDGTVAAGSLPTGTSKDLISQIPGQVPQTITGSIKQGLKETFDKNNFSSRQAFKESAANPLNVKGVNANVHKFGPVRAGREVEGQVENMAKLDGFISKLSQGYDPAAAAREVLETFGGVDNLSKFEQTVMRRVMPFYAWSRHQLPYQVNQLATNPGGLSGQAIRATGALRSNQDFLPEYLGGSMAVPIGGESPEGNQRYLTGLQMPWESVMEPFAFGTGGAGRTVEKLLGQTNPLLKAPLENLSGRQFYSGRNLDDLYGPTGNTLADQAIMNSPAARAYTTGRTLADPRKDILTKALNTLTGVRLSDVDMTKQKDIFARQLAQKLMEQDPNFSKYSRLYVKPENLQSLTPEEVKLLQLYKALEAKASAASREKKQALQQGVP